jgi:hypothetical protein
MATLKLSKPLDVNGSPITELSLDFDKLTAAHVVKAEGAALVARAGVPAFPLRLDTEFQLHLAAEAAGIDAEILHRLNARDALAVMEAVAGFLFASA